MGKPLSKASTVAFRDGIAESWADNSVEIERGKSLKRTNSRVVILLGLTDKIVQLLEEQKGCESAIYLHGICGQKFQWSVMVALFRFRESSKFGFPGAKCLFNGTEGVW